MARLSVLQELTVAALELFNPEKSPDAFLDRLAERVGCYATLLVEIDPASGVPSVVGASGLGPEERGVEIPTDTARALAEGGPDLRLPHPTLSRPSLTHWLFPIAGPPGTRAALLLYFFWEGTPHYRGMVRHLVEILSTVLIHRDLFARTRESERRLDQQKTLLENVSDASAVGMLLIGAGDDVVFSNTYFIEMFGLDPALRRGSWKRIVHVAATRLEDPAAFAEWVDHLVARPGEEAKRDLITSDGRVFECFSAAVTGPTGAPHGRGMYFRDITERTRAIAERERLLEMEKHARAAMEDALRARDDFISVASHELRTPLNALQLGLATSRAEVDSAGRPTSATLRALDVAERQVKRLVSLVDALLDVSRIRAGRMGLELEPVDLAAVTREVIARFEDESARSGSTISLDAPSPVVGSWDRSRIDQVVTNLLANAIKYGAGRPVEVSLARDGAVARLVVRDHGVGIGADNIERIFQRFERAAPERGYGGLGLGLYIVREIVERHGGTVGVASEPNVGSTFTLCLPLRPPERGG